MSYTKQFIMDNPGKNFDGSPIESYAEDLREMPTPVIIQAGDLLVLSKTNATEFHQKMREMIMETGYGLFEYLEILKFFENVNKCVKGDSQTKMPEDSEFINLVREELSKHDKGKYLTTRGVKFELAETGTSYDFSNCGDVELEMLEAQAQRAAEKVKERKEFIKNVPAGGIDVVDPISGEVIHIYPPVKNSKSSYKITLAK